MYRGRECRGEWGGGGGGVIEGEGGGVDIIAKPRCPVCLLGG